MNAEKWALLKNDKNFYRRTYRWGIKSLFVSLVLNVLLVLAIFYFYVTLPERDYYATNGETPPQQLSARLEPNKGPTPLLAPDPDEVNVEKVVPQ